MSWWNNTTIADLPVLVSIANTIDNKEAFWELVDRETSDTDLQDVIYEIGALAQPSDLFWFYFKGWVSDNLAGTSNRTRNTAILNAVIQLAEALQSVADQDQAHVTLATDRESTELRVSSSGNVIEFP